MRLKAELPLAAITILFASSSALAANTSLDPITQSETFPAWQTTLSYQVPVTPTNIKFGAGFSKATTSVKYDAATHSYTVRDTGSTTTTSTFAPANKSVPDSNASFTVYKKTSGTTTESLRLLNPGAANPTFALTYTTYGEWKRTTTGAGYQGATIVNDTWVVFGVKTPKASMPHSGTGNYSTFYDGSFRTPGTTYAVSGTGTLTANFGSGSISYAANLTGTPSSGPAIAFGPLSGTGTISFNGSSFTGKADNANPTYKLGLSGYFFGPAAQEVGGVFQLSGGGGTGTGAVVGH